MIVRNKKTGKDYSISTSDWEVIKERKQSQLFTVVDASELKQKASMPVEIINIINAKQNTPQNEKSISENSDESTGVTRRRSSGKTV